MDLDPIYLPINAYAVPALLAYAGAARADGNIVHAEVFEAKARALREARVDQVGPVREVLEVLAGTSHLVRDGAGPDPERPEVEPETPDTEVPHEEPVANQVAVDPVELEDPYVPSYAIYEPREQVIVATWEQTPEDTARTIAVDPVVVSGDDLIEPTAPGDPDWELTVPNYKRDDEGGAR